VRGSNILDNFLIKSWGEGALGGGSAYTRVRTVVVWRSKKKHFGSISPTFYELLLRAPQFPKAQKDTDDLTVFFALLGSVHKKAAHKTLVN